MSQLNPFVLIVGPTASGKSRLGLALAHEFKAGILNCDSLQTYQRLDIGTAKPTLEERASVPHFLFDCLAPGEVLTAGDYRRMAHEVLERELPRQMILGVGGSGFYIQAIEKGMFDVPKPDPGIERQTRQEISEKGPDWLFAEVARLDSEYARRLSANDTYRLSRALIMIRDSGKTVTAIKAAFKPEAFPFPLLKLGLAPSQSELLPAVEERTRLMLKAGFLEEVEALVNDGLRDWPPLASVGYKECVLVLGGLLPREKLHSEIVEKTMQLAKKQKTWFKRDANTHWLDFSNPMPQAKKLIADFIES